MSPVTQDRACSSVYPPPEPCSQGRGLLELGFCANHRNQSCSHFLVLSQWGLPSRASGLGHTGRGVLRLTPGRRVGAKTASKRGGLAQLCGSGS